MRFNNSFTGIANSTPPSQVLPVGFIVSLLARRQQLRAIRPLIGTGEIADEGISELNPTIDAML